MTAEQIKTEYAQVCEQQRRLRSELLLVNLRKMRLSIDITRIAHGKPPFSSPKGSEEDKLTLAAWQAATLRKAQASGTA